MKKNVLVYVSVLVLALLVGCQSPGPQNMQEQMEYMKLLSEFARENDMALSISLNFTGRAGFYAEEAVGVNTGIQLQATIIANAGDSDSPN